MSASVCQNCKARAVALDQECAACGFRVIIEPEAATRERFLRAPSLGALFFTQGWALGARLYLWFVLSMIPLVGFVALAVCFVFGRRLAWKQGGWTDWEEYERRLKHLDWLAVGWIGLLVCVWWLAKKN